MADNVGLTTPRGSGTSGYVQKNRSLLRPRDRVAPYQKDQDYATHRPRQPDAEILEHEAKRDVEVKVFELRDKLEEQGVDEDDIDDQCEALRHKLDQERKDGKDLGPNAKRLKSHQVHDLAKAKMEESERLRKALGISEDYEEGSHWRKQEERMRDSLAKREAEDEVKTERAREARRYKDEDSNSSQFSGQDARHSLLIPSNVARNGCTYGYETGPAAMQNVHTFCPLHISCLDVRDHHPEGEISCMSAPEFQNIILTCVKRHQA